MIPSTQYQLQQLRVVAGGGQWLATLTRLDLSDKVLPKTQVRNFLQANKQVRAANASAQHFVRIMFVPLSSVHMGRPHGGAWTNRADGRSQESYLLFLTDEYMQRGQVSSHMLGRLEKLEIGTDLEKQSVRRSTISF